MASKERMIYVEPEGYFNTDMKKALAEARRKKAAKSAPKKPAKKK